jgi:GTP-binding protein
MRVLSRFVTSAVDAAHFPPPELPEIAFLGRSNVGKSSLINSLVGTKIAKTSSTPGRTQMINFFELQWPGKSAPEMQLVDLPGYGYARVPKTISSTWGAFIDPYLKYRPTLALCVVLVDLNVPPQNSDGQLLAFLSAAGRPFLLAATKCDKLSSNQRRNALAALQRAYPDIHVLAYSAKTGDGRDALWHELRTASQNASKGPAPTSAGPPFVPPTE